PRAAVSIESRSGCRTLMVTMPFSSPGDPRTITDRRAGRPTAVGSRLTRAARTVGGTSKWWSPAAGRSGKPQTGRVPAPVPNWSRDGKWIYFASDRTGRFEIWRVPAEGGTAEQITRDGGYLVFESTDVQTLYDTKIGDIGGGPLYARSVSGADETQVV